MFASDNCSLCGDIISHNMKIIGFFKIIYETFFSWGPDVFGKVSKPCDSCSSVEQNVAGSRPACST